MFYRATLILLLAVAASFGAQAAELADENKEKVVYEPTRYYWGLDYISYSGSSYSSNIGMRLGYDFTDYLALEGNVTRSTSSSTGISITLASLFGRANLRVSDVTLFGLLGTSQVTVTGFDGMTELSYGLGIDLYGSEHTSLTIVAMNHSGLDYNQTPVKDNISFSSISFGLKHYFDLPGIGRRY